MQGENSAAQIGNGVSEHGLQLGQRSAHIGGSRSGQVRPKGRFEAQPGQVLRHAVVNLVGDAAALGLDGFRLSTMLFFGSDVFNRDDHMAVIRRVRCCGHAHRKECAVSTPVGGFGHHGLALLHAAQGGRRGCFGYQVGGRHPHQLGGRIAIDQFCPPVHLDNGRRDHGQVDDEDANGGVIE